MLGGGWGWAGGRQTEHSANTVPVFNHFVLWKAVLSYTTLVNLLKTLCNLGILFSHL